MRQIYRTIVVMLAIGTMTGCLTGCGCGKKSSAETVEETTDEITDLDSYDVRIWGEESYEQILTTVRNGMEGGWTNTALAITGLGSFAEEEGMEIGYAIEDLDGDDYKELILAKKGADQEEYRVCTIYTIMESGAVNTVYRSGNDTEARILEDNVILVTSLDEDAGEEEPATEEEDSTADPASPEEDSAAEEAASTENDSAGEEESETDYETVWGYLQPGAWSYQNGNMTAAEMPSEIRERTIEYTSVMEFEES